MKKWSRNKTEGEYFALETLVFFYLIACLVGWLADVQKTKIGVVW